MTGFDEFVQEIKYTFKTGGMKVQEKHPDDEKITTLKEVILFGSKARGAGYRVRKALQDEFNFVPVTFPEQKIQECKEPTVFYMDMKRIVHIPQRFREYAKSHENVSILVVDVNKKEKHIPKFSYSFDADHFIKEGEKDIDPAISKIVAELYLNVYGAVDEEGIVIPGKGLVKPYFKTSFLIDYERTRDILEGMISSVVRKFDPDVIASRETVGVVPEDVKMYELAKPIAKRLGIESAMIEKGPGGYFTAADLRKTRVLLLEDVIGDAATKIKLIKALRERGAVEKEKGRVNACVVLLDRNEGARKALEKEKVELYSLTDLATYERLAAERKSA